MEVPKKKMTGIRLQSLTRVAGKEVRNAVFDRVINLARRTGEDSSDDFNFVLFRHRQYQVPFTDRAAQNGEETPFHC